MILLALLPALAQSAPALPAVNLQRWSPPPSAQGTAWTWDASGAPRGWFTTGLGVGWQKDPLVWRGEDGVETRMIASAFETAAFGVWSAGRVWLGAELPAHLAVRGDAVDADAALGDVSLSIEALALDPDRRLGLAVLGRVWLPTTTGAQALWAAEAPSYELSLVADLDLGESLLAFNLGTQGQPKADYGDFAVDDALTARLGATTPVVGPLSVAADVVAALPWSAPFADVRAAPAEALLSADLRLGRDWRLGLGGGRGLSAGVGAPDARVVSWVRYDPPRTQDRDQDGVLDAVDACPDAPEDRDGYQDADGCADPLTAVTLRLVDPSGQPRPDVPLRLGAHTGAGELRLELPAGAATVTAEAAGFLPLSEALVIVDGPPVERTLTLRPMPVGTLELRVLDPDRRPIPTATWSVAHATLPPLVNGMGVADLPVGRGELVASAPGFVSARFPIEIAPGERLPLTVTLQRARVEVTREKLVITDKIFFDTNRATIRPESLPLLDEIVSVLLDRKDIAVVRIEGHTDSRGSNQTNLVLSDQRASAVRDYLVGHGVAPERLRAVGYGETRPLVDRQDTSAWDRNRRVEFFIERWQE